jgi:hypothetical protein
LSLTSTYKLRPPWTGIAVTCYQAPLLLQNNKTSERHRRTTLNIASPFHGGISVSAHSTRHTWLHNTSSQHNEKTNRRNGAITIPSFIMDKAQHIPTSAHHGTEQTMQTTERCDPTGDSLVLLVAKKLRAFYRAIVQSKPPIDSTSTTHSPNNNPCRTADGYQSKACQPNSTVAKWTITQKIPPGPEQRYRMAAPAYDTTKPQWEVTYLGWGQPSSRSRTAVFVPPVAAISPSSTN